MTCAITGVVQTPDGSPLISSRIIFKRLSNTAAIGAIVVVPDTYETVTDGSGNVSITLYPGQYEAKAFGDRVHRFLVGVPDEATATFASLIDQFPAITSSLTQDVLDAQVAAAASALTAATAATAAEAAETATAADVVATAADRIATGADATATAADRVQTGADATATAADRVQTGLDAIATAADRVQTGLDAAATAADRVQTGIDATAAAASAASAAAENSSVVTVAETTLTPTVVWGYHRCTNASGCAVTIPTNASSDFAIGAELHFRQCAAGAVTVTGDVGVTVNVTSGFSAETAALGGVLTAKKVAADEWDLFGLLVAA